jgi:hypothetical protein
MTFRKTCIFISTALRTPHHPIIVMMIVIIIIIIIMIITASDHKTRKKL